MLRKKCRIVICRLPPSRPAYPAAEFTSLARPPTIASTLNAERVTAVFLSEPSNRMLRFRNALSRRVAFVLPCSRSQVGASKSPDRHRQVQWNRSLWLRASGSYGSVSLPGPGAAAPFLGRGTPTPGIAAFDRIGPKFALPSTKSWRSLRTPIRIGGSGGQPGRNPTELIFPVSAIRRSHP